MRKQTGIHILSTLLCLAGAAVASAQAPANLTVTKATNKEVDLTWTSTATSFNVQRRQLGGSYTTIANVTTAQYNDTTIDAYQAYQYQVVAGSSAASNSVTVGPPPAGFNNVAPAPSVAGSPVSSYGKDLSMTLDGNGDPAFAFIFEDPTQSGDSSTSQLLFRSWNRAQYTWNPLVTVGVVGDVASTLYNSTAIAYDPSNSTYVLASDFETASGDGVRLYVSTDGGLTWTDQQNYTSTQEEFYGPSVALKNGNIYFAVIEDTAGLRFYSGPLSSINSLTQKNPTKPANTDIAEYGTGVSVAVDSSGDPAVVYWAPDTRSDENYNQVLLFWRPLSSGGPTVVTDSENNQTSVASKLVFNGTNPRIAFYALRNDSPNGEGIHFVRSDDGGTTWQTPVLIPPDGTSTTDYPADMALDSQGNGAIAFGQNGGTGDTTCGNPKLSRSTDLVHWTTCAVADVSITGNFDVYPDSVQVAFGGNDKLYLMWKEQYDNGSGTGVIMYREPPAGASTTPVIQASPSGQPEVSDGASFRSNIVAGSWVTIFGLNFADAPANWDNLDFSNGLPTTLAGIQVTFNGQFAATYYAQSNQVNVQAPTGLSGNVSVQVIKNGVASNVVTATVVDHAPGLFTYSLDNKTFYPAAVFPNGIIVGDPAVAGNSVAKAHPGDIIMLYSTGLGASPGGVLINAAMAFPDTVTVTLSSGSTSVQAAVSGTYLVAPGEYQTNIVVPAGLAPGNYSLVLTTDGASTQSGVILPVTN